MATTLERQARESLAKTGLVSPDPLEIEGAIEELPTPVEAPTPVVVESSDAARDEVSRIQGEISTLQTEVQEKAQQRETLITEQKKAEVEKPSREATFIDPDTGQKFIFGDPDINRRQIEARGLEFLEGVAPRFIRDADMSPEENQIITADTEIDEEFETLNKELDTLRESILGTGKRVIENIQNIYSQRRNQLKDINKRSLESLRTIGIRLGGARFAPSVQAGLLSSEERAGLQQIQALDAEEATLILEAEQAIKAQEFQTLQEKMNLFAQKRAEKDKAIEKQQKLAVDRAKLILDQDREARLTDKQNEEQAKDFISEIGIITLNSLTGNELEDAETIAGMARLNGIEPNRLLAEILKQNQDLAGDLKFISGTKTQTSGTFDPKTGIFTPMRGGVGGGGVGGRPGRLTQVDVENAPEDEQLTITRVMRLLPTKLKDSEVERADRKLEILRAIRSGQGVQDIVDEIKGFVITDSSQQGFATYMRTLAAGSDVDLSDLASTINRGNLLKSMTIVENANLENAQGEFGGSDTTRNVVALSNRVLDLLEKAPIENLGAFDGRTFKVKKFAGLTDKEILDTQRLETALVNLFADLRRKTAGTAVTDSELAFLEPLLADLLDQPEIIKTKVTELKIGTLATHNEQRGQVTLPHVTEDELINDKLRLQLYKEAAQESSTMLVRIIETGELGKIDPKDFNPNTMTQE